jgi:hypothetical protein
MTAQVASVTLWPVRDMQLSTQEAPDSVTLQLSTFMRGPGVPAGGTTHQVLRKASNSDFDDEWHSLVSSDITGALGYTPEDHAAKDASGGFAGLTGFLINLKDAAGSIVSFMSSAATIARTWTFPDKSGTVAMTSDVITDHTALSNIGANTHAQIDTALTRLANTSGTNTGDQDLTTYALKTYVDAAVVGLWDLKGSTDCSANPNYPVALKGDAYVVSVAGRIGGASGTVVDQGDVFVALVDNAGGSEASVGSSWLHVEHNLIGALVASNNLSDLTNTATARANLGVPGGSGTSTGTNTGDQTSVTGNAGTATALQTPRRINGKLFDGTANISTLNRTAVKTANYAAAANELVPCDSTSGGFTVTLPTAPADGSPVAVKHILQGGTNTITIACGGSDVINRAGGATSTTLRLLAEAAMLVYDAATAIWTIVADDVPIAQLDLRYAIKAAYASAADAVAITPALVTNDTTRVTQTNTQVAGTLTLNNPTGTPVDGEILIVRVTCTNAQTLAYGTAYLGTNQLSLPAATTGSSKTDRMVFEYRTGSLKYELIGISFGA